MVAATAAAYASAATTGGGGFALVDETVQVRDHTGSGHDDGFLDSSSAVLLLYYWNSCR